MKKSTYEKIYESMRRGYVNAVKEQLAARKTGVVTECDALSQAMITGYSSCVMNALTAALGSTTLASRILSQWEEEARKEDKEEQ